MNIILVIIIIIICVLIYCWIHHINTTSTPTTIINTDSTPTAKSSSQPASKIFKPNLSSSQIVSKIKNEFMDPNYQFNLYMLPVTTYKENLESYIEKIKTHMIEWNDVLPDKYKIKNIKIKPVYADVTTNEFNLTATISFTYHHQFVLIRASFYGKITIDDIHLNNINCIIQLTNIEETGQHHVFTRSPTMMEKGISYMKKVNKMHRDELPDYF